MEKIQKTGNFHFNTNTLKTYNEITGQGKLLSKEKWAALKKLGPRGNRSTAIKFTHDYNYCNINYLNVLTTTSKYLKLL